jgi:hypothetical protein
MSAWAWSDHVCRTCLGRLVERKDGVRAVFECGNCTHSSEHTPDGICGCGVLPKPSVGRADPSAPRFRCTPNPNRTVTAPAAFVIAWGAGA